MTIEDPGLEPEVRAALCHPLIVKLMGANSPSYDADARPDVYDQCRRGVEAAARTWEPDAGKFITHAWIAVRHALCCGGERRYTKGAQRRVERDWQAARDRYVKDAPADERRVRDRVDGVRAALAPLAPHHRSWIDMWVECDCNASECGRRWGVSASAATERIRSVVERLAPRLRHLTAKGV